MSRSGLFDDFTTLAPRLVMQDASRVSMISDGLGLGLDLGLGLGLGHGLGLGDGLGLGLGLGVHIGECWLMAE